MSDDPKDDLSQRTYPEDERLRELRENSDRRMTRAEWESEDSFARQAAHKKHEQVKHDREVQERYDKAHHKKRRNWNKILLWCGAGVALLAIIFLLGFIPRHEREKRAAQLAKQRQEEEPEVEIVQVKRSNAPGALTVPGTTASQTVAYIYARANGYITRRFVDIGDHVKKGQLMALIDAPDLDQQVAQAREQLRQAEALAEQQRAQLKFNQVTWDRWRVLVAKGVFSRQDGDQQETNYNTQVQAVASAERNVESYRANLDRMIALQQYERVTAPFDGVVTERNVDQGALVGATGAGGSPPSQLPAPQQQTGGTVSVASSNTSGTTGTMNSSAAPTTGSAQGGALFAVAQSGTLRILASVPEGYAADLHPGMAVKVYVQERSGKPISGTLARVADSLDQNTRTMLSEVDIENRDGSLYPGIYAVVSFLPEHGTSPLIIPGDAVVVRQDQTEVAVVRDQKVDFVPVAIGRDYGPSVEVVGGLNEGDWVVATVTDAVQPGIRVHTREARTPGSNGGQPAQSSQVPDSGPDQYGDQSIVNSATESTSQAGKSGQKASPEQQKAQKQQSQKQSKGSQQ